MPGRGRSLVPTASAPARTTTSYPSHHLTHFRCAGHVVASWVVLCFAALRCGALRSLLAQEKHWEHPIHHRTAKPRPPSANRPPRPIQKEPTLSPSLLYLSASSRLVSSCFLYITSPPIFKSHSSSSSSPSSPPKVGPFVLICCVTRTLHVVDFVFSLASKSCAIFSSSSRFYSHFM